MEPMLSLGDLLLHEVKDLYSAEEQIIEALPKMIENASSKELKKALDSHLNVTKLQKTRLDKIRNLLGEQSEAQKSFLERMLAGGTKCKGMEGLIKEGVKMMEEDMDPSVMDAAIIACAQKIEHYEISGYGTAKAYALEIGLADVAKLLQTTLNEEYQADDSLTALAVGKLNLQAELGAEKISENNGGRRRSANENRNSTQNKTAAGKKTSAAKAAAKKSSPAKKTAKKAAAKSSKR